MTMPFYRRLRSFRQQRGLRIQRESTAYRVQTQGQRRGLPPKGRSSHDAGRSGRPRGQVGRRSVLRDGRRHGRLRLRGRRRGIRGLRARRTPDRGARRQGADPRGRTCRPESLHSLAGWLLPDDIRTADLGPEDRAAEARPRPRDRLPAGAGPGRGELESTPRSSPAAVRRITTSGSTSSGARAGVSRTSSLTFSARRTTIHWQATGTASADHWVSRHRPRSR